MEKMQESINKDLEELKNKHTNNTITKIKTTLEWINSKISEAEEWISELEDKMVEITSEEQSEKNKKSWGQSQRPLGQYQTDQHLNYRGILEEEKKKGYEKLFEDIVENFPNMEKEIANQVQEAQSPIQDKPTGNTQRHILIKLTKTKHK